MQTRNVVMSPTLLEIWFYSKPTTSRFNLKSTTSQPNSNPSTLDPSRSPSKSLPTLTVSVYRQPCEYIQYFMCHNSRPRTSHPLTLAEFRHPQYQLWFKTTSSTKS